MASYGFANGLMGVPPLVAQYLPRHYDVIISPAQVAANTTAEQTFALIGLNTADLVYVNKPTAQAGLGIVGCRVSAADTLAITFSNNTASPITPTASQTYKVIAIKCS